MSLQEQAPQQLQTAVEVQSPQAHQLTPEETQKLGHDPVQLVQLKDGSVTTLDAIKVEREAGHDMSDPNRHY